MEKNSIDKVLESRRQAAEPPAAKVEEGDRFYSILGGDVIDDPFLEFRFRDGFKLSLPYRDVIWISYHPKEPEIKVDFGTVAISIIGRGLDGELFEGIKNKRVVWIKECDSEMQDNDTNKVFIEEISFEPEEKEPDPEKGTPATK
jgi:hypothetical protein